MKELFSNKFGIVLTDTRVIVSRNGNLILDKIGCVTRYRPTNKLVCPGAVYCIDLAPNGDVSFPVRQGVVCDFEGTTFLLNEYIKFSTNWLQRLNPVGNMAMRGCLTESEIRALKDCFCGKRVRVFIMQEIISTILGLNDAVLIYIADGFIEISLIKDYKIIKLVAKESALNGLRYAIMKLVDEQNFKIGERVLAKIIGDFFGGKDAVICGPNKSTNMPMDLILSPYDVLSKSSLWIDTIKNYIEDFIKENDFDGNIYLMSDYDNVDFLTQELSSRGNVRISPITNSLEKIAIELSLR